MRQITIKFTGDHAEEAKEAFFDWWESSGENDFNQSPETAMFLSYGFKADGNTITIKT